MAEAAEMGAGEHVHHDLPRDPVAPAVQPRSDHAGTEIMSEEEEGSGQALAAPPTASVPAKCREQQASGHNNEVPAHNIQLQPILDVESGAEVSRSTSPRLLPPSQARQDLRQAPVSPVVEARGERASTGDILWEEEEEDSRRAPAATPTASGPVDRQQQQARESLGVEGGGGLSRSCPNNWFTSLCVSAHPKYAKWVYGVILLGGILFAMTSRDREISGYTDHNRGYNVNRYLIGAESALRVFFTVMFVTTVRTKKVHAYRNLWNSNLGWALLGKVVLMAGCLYVAQLPPSWSIQAYGNIARAGAWLFLAIQLISVTRLIMWLNTWYQSNPEGKRRWLVKPAAILSNFGSFGFILWLLHDHRHRSDIIDFTIAGITLMLIVLMICIYLKYEVTAGWVAPGLMMSYVVFMCWTVIKSEPHRDINKAKDPKGPDWLTIMSLVFMAYSTLSTGEDHDWLQFNEDVPSDDDLPYGLGYFHLVFALGSMYFGMVLVGWNAHQTMQRWTIDYGWWSAFVRVGNGLLATVLYIWMLRTPFIWDKTKVVLSRSGDSRMPHVTFL